MFTRLYTWDVLEGFTVSEPDKPDCFSLCFVSLSVFCGSLALLEASHCGPLSRNDPAANRKQSGSK